MALLKGLSLTWSKKLILYFSFTCICINFLGQATALISYIDSSDADAHFPSKTFIGDEAFETQRSSADEIEVLTYPRASGDHENLKHSRRKRDLKEIIAQQNLTFPPEIVRRTRAALQGIKLVTTHMKNFIENPPLNETTAAPDNTTVLPITTESAEPNTTLSVPDTEATTTTTTTSEESTTTTTPQPTPPPSVNATPPATTTPTTTTVAPSTPNAVAPSTRDPATNSSGNRSSGIVPAGRGLFSSRGIMAIPEQRKASELPGGRMRFSVSETIVSLQIALNASERVMMDKLSAETVIVLEESLANLIVINKSLPIINLDEEKEKLLFWAKFLLLSVRHSLQRMRDEENANYLLSKADDITIVITAGFCVLAIIFVGALLAYSLKSRKENRGNYKIDMSPKKSNLRNNPSKNPDSSTDQNADDPNSFFSIPSGVTVQTRSNPMYSSHRSVDVERLPTVSTLDKYRNDDSRSDDNSRTGAESNANGRDRRAVSPSADSSVTSFREPGRNKDRKYDAAKDNEGFLDDDAVEARRNSESVLEAARK